MDAAELLKSVSGKTRKLVEEHRQLREQVQQLQLQLETKKSELQQLAVEKGDLSKSNLELREQIKTIKLAQSLSSGSDDQNTRMVKSQINEYIREIDKCLSLLNRE